MSAFSPYVKNVLEGEVLRRSLFCTWRRMYMMMREDGSVVQYKENPQLYPEETLRGSFSMKSVVQVVCDDAITKQPHTFIILLKDAPPMLIKTKDGNEQQQWVSKMSKMINYENEKLNSNKFALESLHHIPIPCFSLMSKRTTVETLNSPAEKMFGVKKSESSSFRVASFLENIEDGPTLGGIPREVKAKKQNGESMVVLLSKLDVGNHSIIFFHDINDYDDYLDEELEEIKDEVYYAQNRDLVQTDEEQKTIRLFVQIEGMSPFVLRLSFGLQIHHYQKIVTMYYSDKLYNKKPPGPLFLLKIVNFPNGDKLMEFKRKQSPADKFSMESQATLPIYEEPEACEHSIVMQKCPAPELFAGDVPKVAGINRLLLLITDYYAPTFLEDVMWYTYRSSIKPKIVLNKILQRYFVPELSEKDYIFNDFEKSFFTTVICVGIKRKCLNLIYKFVTHYQFDFDEEMLVNVKEFLDQAESQLSEASDIATTVDVGLKCVIDAIRQTLPKMDRKQPWQKVRSIENIFGVVENKKAKMLGAPKKEFNIFEALSAKEIAEQLTYMDYTLYNEIHFTEILDQAWNKDKRRHQAPNVMLNINFLNKVSSWLAYCILNSDELPNRVKLLKKILQVLGFLKDLNSFNMVMAVIGGLGGTPIHRLSQTWDEIDERSLQIRQQCNELSSSKGNSKAFRVAMNDCYTSGKPCAPYIGIYLRDLVFTDDGNPTIMDGKINFSKCTNTYNVMHQVLRFRGRPYDIDPNKEFIQEMLDFDEKKVNENYLHDLSLQVQPRK